MIKVGDTLQYIGGDMIIQNGDLLEFGQHYEVVQVIPMVTILDCPEVSRQLTLPLNGDDLQFFIHHPKVGKK